MEEIKSIVYQTVINLIQTINKIPTLIIVWVITSGAIEVSKNLAGKKTEFYSKVFVSIITESWIDKILIGISIISVVWASIERYIRKRQVKELSARIKKLELEVDPSKSSSGLQTNGKTNKED